MVAKGNRHYAVVPLGGCNGLRLNSIYDAQKLVLNRQQIGQRGEIQIPIVRQSYRLTASANVCGENSVSGMVHVFKPSIVLGDEIALRLTAMR